MDTIYKASEDSATAYLSDSRLSLGLEDVYIKPTRLTYIDGERGELRYLGYRIEDIISSGASAEVIQYAFLYGKLPDDSELARFKTLVEKGYELPDYVVSSVAALPRSSDVVGMQAVAMASLAAGSDFQWRKTHMPDAFATMLGQMAAITVIALRHAMGKEPKLPSPTASYARSFLVALQDKEPSDEKVRALDQAIILYLDHEVPASTTAGLVTVSTLADPYSAVLSALAALRGPLHGGATEGVMAQLNEVGEPQAAKEWFDKNVASGKKRLMGFGHRVYKTYDPRALIFKSIAIKLASEGQLHEMLATALALEQVGLKSLAAKGIYPNADFYSPIVYASLGIPYAKGAYTAMFALSRTAGWLAHFEEYVQMGGRIIRPRALYIGPALKTLTPKP
ncbi:MAG: citrate/2-methylcitrate synthase [Thermoprotei archaeon]|nr:citrate/2-methylcitrate synthase [TACK group archaeon]